MLTSLVLTTALAAGTLPPESAVILSLRKYTEGHPVKGVGPIPLAALNFWRHLRLGPERTAVVISMLWDSGVFFFGPAGRPLNLVTTSEVLRLWTVDLDGDGVLELLTEERVVRGTGLLACEFRLYAASQTGRLIWSAESQAYADPWWQGFPYERRSYVRILDRENSPRLEYRYPCGSHECTKTVRVVGGEAFEE